MKIDWKSRFGDCVQLVDIEPGECFQFAQGNQNEIFMRTDMDKKCFAKSDKVSVTLRAINLENGVVVSASNHELARRIKTKVVVES